MRFLDFPHAAYIDASVDGRVIATWLDGKAEFIAKGKVVHTWKPRECAAVLQVQLGPGESFAGQTVAGNRIVEWDGVGFHDRSPAYGLHACVYRGEELICNPLPTEQFGGLGFRQISDSGRIVSVAETYLDPFNQIAEWTVRGDIRAGQGILTPGYEDDYLAIDQFDRRYVLDERRCWFINFHRDGELGVVAYSLPTGCRVVWFEVSELGESIPALRQPTPDPIIIPPVIKPPVTPPVVIPPDPIPPSIPPLEPTKMKIPTYDEFVKAEAQQVFDAYSRQHGHPPALPNMYHNAYRRLVEGWSHANILHSIREEPLESQEPP